jgi:RNA polymerase sigma factor (sigma-70 family)
MTASSVGDLLARAAAGDQSAWDALVGSYERLVWSVVRGFRFDDATTADVFQTVWLRFVEHIQRIRSPDAVASWLATTARHESIRVSRARARQVPTDFEYDLPDTSAPSPAERAELAAEEMAAVEAFSRLGEPCQELLRLLIAEPPLDYEAISGITGRPVGSIGPTRGRCLDRLRRLMAGW